MAPQTASNYVELAGRVDATSVLGPRSSDFFSQQYSELKSRGLHLGFLGWVPCCPRDALSMHVRHGHGLSRRQTQRLNTPSAVVLPLPAPSLGASATRGS